jgi:uncharacterized protein
MRRGLVVATLLALAAPAWAVTIPPHPDGPINDYAHVLAPEAVKRLTDQLLSYEQGTTRQIAVAIFPSLDGEDIDDFAIHVAEKWKIGSSKNDNGVLITIAIAERKDRIDVGYGLEGQLTDALTRRIRTELMEPRFKAGDFEGGLREAFAAIDTATGGHEHPEGKLPARTSRGQPSGGKIGGLLIFIIFFVVIFVIIAVRGGGRGGGGGGGFWIGGGGWSGGSSGWSSGGGGGGWSGGGGSFGGGGSSGSW